MLFPLVLFPYAIEDVKTRSKIRRARRNEYRRKGKAKKGKIVRGSRFRSASFCSLDFLELIRIAPLSSLQPPPFTRLFSRSYSRAVLLPFFAPEGNTEHLLREIKKKRLSGTDARLRSSRCIRRRNDNSSRRILAFLIY